jgi:hypothetical protein
VATFNVLIGDNFCLHFVQEVRRLYRKSYVILSYSVLKTEPEHLSVTGLKTKESELDIL